MASADTISTDRIRDLVQKSFTDATRDSGYFSPASQEPYFEIAEQRAYAEERLNELAQQLPDGPFDSVVQRTARHLLSTAGVDIGGLTKSTIHDVLVGVARAQAEQERKFIFRLRDRLIKYEPTDELFRARVVESGVALTAPLNSAVTEAPSSTGPTVQEASEKYLCSKKRSWTGKTHAIRTRQLALLVEHLGSAKPLALVTTEDMRGFRDGLGRLRRNHHVGASTSFVGRQTEHDSQRITAKTASLQFETAKSWLQWTVAEGYISASPATNLRLQLPKQAKSKKVRRPYTANELSTLFSAPVFTGCKAVHRRFEGGDRVFRDAYFWIPILAYLTGARLGEIIQLHRSDVHLEGPVPFIRITDEAGGEIGSGDEKHIKSAAAFRDVPLHPELLALGFLDFVRLRSSTGSSRKRLFFEIRNGQDGQASTVFSKWFARMKRKAGLVDAALVFHSFRHNAEDAFRNAKEPAYVIDQIIGHADGKVSSQYGQGVSLEVKQKAIEAMQLPISLAEFWASPAVDAA